MNNGQSALDQFLGNVGRFVGGAAQGIGNFVNQNVVTPVEQFAGQAASALNAVPQTFVQPTPQTPSFPAYQRPLDIAMQNQQQNRPINVPQLQQQMNTPTATNPLMSLRQYMDSPQGQQLVQNNMGIFQTLAAIQNMGGQIPSVNFQQYVPQGLPAPVDFAAKLVTGIPESIINVPHDIWAGGTQLGSDLATGAINKPQTALADAAQVGLPLLTILSFGGAGSLLKSLGEQTGKSLGGKILAGALGAAPVGTLFGEMAGLEQGRNAPDVQSQIAGSLPYAAMGTVGGMIIGGIFGPVSQYFFGGEPGRAAVLSERGAIPEDQVNIARATLGVKPGATEAEVRTAYMDAMKKVHPDVGGDNAAATVVNNAYEILAKTKAPTDVNFNTDGDMSAKYHTTQDNPTITPDIVDSLTLAYQKANELYTPETFGKPTLPAQTDNGLISPNNIVPTNDTAPVVNAFNPNIHQDFSKAVTPVVDKFGLSGYTPEEYQGFKTALSTDKNTGYAIKPDGDLISVFNVGTKGNGAHAVVDAINNGATKLDAFDGGLPTYYKQFGFEEVSRLKWDDQYAPANWDYEKNGRPDIVYMVLNPSKYEQFLQSWNADPAKLTGPVFERNFRANGPTDTTVKPTGISTTNLTQGSVKGGIETKAIPVKTPQVPQEQSQVNLAKVKQGDVFNVDGQILKATKQPMYNKGGKLSVQLQNQESKQYLYLTQEELNTLLAAAKPGAEGLGIEVPKLSTGDIDTVKLVKQLREEGWTPEEIQAIKSDLAETEAIKKSMQEEAKVKETEAKTEPKPAPMPVKKPELVPTTQVSPAPSAELVPAKVPVTSIKTPEETKISVARTKAAKKAADKVAPTPPTSQPLAQPTQADKPITAGNEVPPIAPPPSTEPPAMKTIQEYDPNNTLTGYFKMAADNMLRPTDSFKTGTIDQKRDLVRLEQKKEISGEKIAELLQHDITKILPDVASREKVQYALGDQTEVAGLTPEEKAVYDQMKIVNTIIKDLKVARDPNFNPIEDYSTLYTVPKPGTKPKVSFYTNKKTSYGLSTHIPENVDRNVKTFIPQEGGPSITGTPEQLKLKQSGEDKNIFENKDGLIYTAKQATQREGEAAGVNYEKDVAKTFARNYKNSYTFKTRTDFLENLKSGEFDGDISTTPKAGWSTTHIKGLEGIYVSPKMEKTLSDFGINNEPSNIVSGAYQEFINATRGLIFYNGIKHNLNMAVDSIIGAGRAGPLGAPKLMMKLLPIFYDMVLHPTPESMQKFVDIQNKGIGLDEFGRQASMPGIFQRTASHIISDPEVLKMVGIADTLNPLHQLYRLSSLATRAGDNTLRIALHDTLKEAGYTDAETSQIVNRWLVDYGNTGAFEKNVVNRVLIFYPWMKGEAGMYGDMAAHPKQNFWPIVNFVILMAMAGAATDMIKKVTGNPDASISEPGILGMAHDVYDSVGQVQKGEIPNVLVSHLQIPIKEGIAQATNKKRLNDLLIPGKSPIVDDNATPMDQASARLAHAGKGLIAPWNAGEPLATGTKSIPEFLANQVNIYTPHLKGFQGAPSGNLDWMGYNTSNEKPSTGMDIIHAQDQVRAMLGNQGMADWQKVKDLRQQGFTDSSSDAYGLANAMIVKNPKLYDAYAITAQAAAKAKGMQVDPQYDPKNKDVALRYLAYQGWTTAQQAAYSSKNTDIVQLQREINTYKSSKDYADNRNEIATAMGEPAPKPFVPNPIYANQPGKNIPIFDNKQLATKQVYDAMPTGAFNSQEYVNKEIYLANHPEAQLVTIAEIPYWQAILQNKWDNRPQGQDVSSFIAANTKADGSLPNIKGVDQNGKIIPNYNQLDSPKIKLWMAHPEQGALLNIYYAGLGSKNYPIANAAMASLQSMGFDYAKYKADNKQFSIDNPYSADLGTGDTTGLGIDFGTGASGGSGGGGGYSSSGNGATTGMWNAVNDTSNIRVRTKLQDNTAASNAIFKASPGIDWNKELIALKKATPKMTDFKFTDGGKISIKNRRPSSDVTLKNSLGRII